ncbi:STM4015 family protein [Limnoglobus roseus]|uniref:TIGR02996 domain-containing protein n=1 Tax=Limnoglobus roseus TaxID=2598579 RepID=A0A5C1AL98_9BACT|nr:STM4015 family protein [Limnoglobus roseus]QEL17964.1 hypothetical protein PX52LOC_04978 [Limnoglobus roseus]
MTISSHYDTFAGRPVREYAPSSPGPAGCVYRLTLGYDDWPTFPELLDRFLADHGGPTLTALVVGAWESDDMLESSAEIVEALIGAKDRMPNLTALFFGDITCEECEMSWIQHGDVSPLLPAFPKLEQFRIRGTTGLTFGKLSHPNLRWLAIESGGLSEDVLGEVWTADLPRLEHLELWLGDDGYGGIDTVDPLAPLLSGKLFPKVKQLGLRNSCIANAVAQAIVASPLLARLEVLDLSLGNVDDVGAEALLASPGVAKLRHLDLHHNYISDAMAERLQQLGVQVDLSDREEADEDDRYVTVSE